jgi:hypothetical protein
VFESFLEKVESFVVPIIKSEVVPYVKESLLWIGLSIRKSDNNLIYHFGIIDVMVAKAALSIWGSKVELHWRSSDGSIVLASDDVADKEISFWIENMPSQERLQQVVERNEYMWKRPTKEATIDKSFIDLRFEKWAGLVLHFQILALG